MGDGDTSNRRRRAMMSRIIKSDFTNVVINLKSTFSATPLVILSGAKDLRSFSSGSY